MKAIQLFLLLIFLMSAGESVICFFSHEHMEISFLDSSDENEDRGEKENSEESESEKNSMEFEGAERFRSAHTMGIFKLFAARHYTIDNAILEVITPPPES